MANDNWDDFDGDDQQDVDGPKQLREAYKRLQKEADKLRKENEALARKQRQADVKHILEEVGVNPKVARFVLQDVEDVTKDAVTEWVNENGELFGISIDDAREDAQQAAPPQGMSADEANALAALNQFATPDASGATQSPLAELEKRIKGAKSAEELTALLGVNQTQAF